jgi:hypothetical protein
VLLRVIPELVERTDGETGRSETLFEARRGGG